MGKIIKNFKDLATDQYRRDALEIVEAAYESIDTENVILNNIVLKEEILLIKGNEYDLSKYDDIYIIGFGKVSCSAALILESILGDRIKSGTVIGISENNTCNFIQTYKGTHPLPSNQNVIASKKLSDISMNAKEKDLVLVIIGGGGSALLCSSEKECDQGIRLYEEFKCTGGSIKEINILRKHISDLKGGGLAKKLYPATVVGLVFSDVPGDDYSIVASGPTYKDESTIDDAQEILDNYNMSGFKLVETPKDDKYFENVKNILMVSNNTALDAMEKAARYRGYDSYNIGSEIYLNQKDTAKVLKKKSKKGTVCIAGGETKLVIPKGCKGVGGRNDSMSLMMLGYLKKNQVFVSFASDGHDNSGSAGCIVDYNTKKEIKNLGIKIKKYKVCLDTYNLFSQTNNLLDTGYLESNVSDLMLLLTYKKNG